MARRKVTIAFIVGLLLPILAIYALSHGLLGSAIFCETDIPNGAFIYLDPAPPAKPSILEAAQRGLEQFRNTQP